jgi:hypothetical protein
MNNDTKLDLVLADEKWGTYSGKIYVIYGTNITRTTNIDLNTPTDWNGFFFEGEGTS